MISAFLGFAKELKLHVQIHVKMNHFYTENDKASCHVGPGTCNTVSGQCEYSLAKNNASCDDGNPCTLV